MKAKLLITNLNSKEGEFERVFPPDLEILTIGRHPSSHVYLASAHISKEHALIIHEYDSFYLVDKSTNGTLLNQILIERDKRNPLKSGDTITVGEFRIIFAIEKELSKVPSQVVGIGIPDMAKPSTPPVSPAPTPVFESAEMEDPFPSAALEDEEETLMPYPPTSFQDVINSIQPGEEVSYLVFMGGEKDRQRVELRGGTSEVYIGRSAKCQVQISHPSIAQTHAKIRLDWAGITIYDLNSQTGVFINGVRINGSRKLRNGDEITFGVPVNMGGAKLRLFDRTSLSSDVWQGLPQPIQVKENESSLKAGTDNNNATTVKPATEESNKKENAATAESTSSAEVDAINNQDAPAKASLGLGTVFYGLTMGEWLFILLLVTVVIVFISIASSLL